MKKRFFLWGAIAIGVILIIFGLIRLSDQKEDTTLAPQDVTTLTERDHVKGQSLARLTLIEYSDFQCPACKSYQPFVKKLTEEFGSRLRFAYRHFPLESIHRNALMAARASEAASVQGKFWEMHDLLFERQGQWAESADAKETFVEYAKIIDLNADQFRKDIDSGDVKTRVNADIESGRRARVNATPTFFINGRKIVNPTSYDAFKELIEQELTSSQ